MKSETIQDYLKAIYEIGREAESVSSNALAEQLGISPASVTGMSKKLADLGEVYYEPYRGLKLTEKGRKNALRVLRAHRLAELYLVKILNVPWDRVHDEAEKWEHVISKEVELRMDKILDHPSKDPHGAPIPEPDGTISYPESIPLAILKPGQSAIVSEVCDQNPALLRYFAQLGMRPDAVVRAIGEAPFEGPLTIEVDGTRHILGRMVAKKISLTNVQP